MASSEAARRRPEKGVTETTAPEDEQLHQDVEHEPDMINIDRIEKVYA